MKVLRKISLAAFAILLFHLGLAQDLVLNENEKNKDSTAQIVVNLIEVLLFTENHTEGPDCRVAIEDSID